MSDDLFLDFVQRLRRGDDSAAVELLEKYGHLMRREARLHLHDPTLAVLYDSGDCCQSVLKSFFVRMAAGQFDLCQPAELRQLLLRMVRNKVAARARKLRARPHDLRRARGLEESREIESVEDVRADVWREVSGRDLLTVVLQHLNEEERMIAMLRGEGRSWVAIATELGGSAEARRKQLNRAVDRVAVDLGLDAV